MVTLWVSFTTKLCRLFEKFEPSFEFSPHGVPIFF